MKRASDPRQQRKRRTLQKYALILGGGFLYLIFVRFTGVGIPCLFNLITGLKCSGCGISRLFISLSKLDFVTAFSYNPFLFITGPFLVAYLVCSDVKYVKSGNRGMGKWESFLIVELVLFVSYGILRNIFPI